MCPSYLISCEIHKRSKVHFCNFHSSENEWIYDWTLMLLKDFRKPFNLSFELIYFWNFFCYRIENSWNFRTKILGHVGPLGKTLIFLSPLGLLKFQDFLSFLFILKLSYSRPFHNTFSYASTANIEEVMKFYNLGDKTFETDFSYWTSVAWVLKVSKPFSCHTTSFLKRSFVQYVDWKSKISLWDCYWICSFIILIARSPLTNPNAWSSYV